MNHTLGTALHYQRAGLSVLPLRLDGSKAPGLPAGHPVLRRERRASEDEIRVWFAYERFGIGVHAGSLSGHAECLDIETEQGLDLLMDILDAVLPNLKDRLCVVRTPRPGWHLWYRLDGPVPPSTVLAARHDKNVLIETRGEGAYAVVPGSPVSVHPNATPYHFHMGRHLVDLCTLSRDQRDTLISCARSFDERLAVRGSASPPSAVPGEDRPSDRFNQSGPSWDEILGAAGWDRVGEGADGRTRWRRPGKDVGVSATTGCTAQDGTELFYNFSTNADPFESGKAYSKFAVHALLNHQGDFKEAARSLCHPQRAVLVTPPPKPDDGVWRTRGGLTMDEVSALIPQSFSAHDLDTMEMPEVRWAVPGLFPEGFVLMAGKPKMGKSWLLYHVALALGVGHTQVLGRWPVGEPQPVLYLALEDTERRLKLRQNVLRPTLGATGRSSLTEITLTWPTFGAGGLDAIEAWMYLHNCRFVVIDVIKKIRADRAGLGVYDADYEFIGALQELAQAYQATIVGVHHLSKRDTDDPFEAISGSLGLNGASDQMMVMSRSQGRLLLDVTGRDVERSTWVLEMDLQTGLFRCLDEEAEVDTISPERRELLDLLNRHPEGLRVSEVVGLTGRKEPAVSRLLTRMAQDGQIARSKHLYCPIDAPVGETGSDRVM